MLRLLIVACALALACCTPAREKRIDIVLRNETSHRLILRADASVFGRSVELGPGEAWYGWVPSGFQPKDIKVTVKEKR